MNSRISLSLGLALVASVSWSAANSAAAATKTETIRGYLSDESCARNRAKGGAYTPTNIDCAKECIAKGKKIVLIDPEKKRVLTISNQEIAKKNVGDYVEITGDVDASARTVHADSLKFLDKTHPMCSVPPKKSASK